MNPDAQKAESTLFDHPNLHLSTRDGLHLTETSSTTSEVEPQIWLDFTLWCCVEGGWITQAAEIVYEMWTRKGESQQYSVIDYKSLNQQHAPKLPWASRIKASIRRSRMREVTGGATFGSYSDRMNFLKPPRRTVSSEVVAAIIDGLVSMASPRPDMFGSERAVVEKYINVCKIILDRNKLGLGFNSWNSVVLRMFESIANDSQLPPSVLEPFVSWSPSLLYEVLAKNSAYCSDSIAHTYVADPSAVSLGLLSRLLSQYTRMGDFRGATRIFRKLQQVVNTNRGISLGNLQAIVTPVLQEDGEDGLIENSEQQEALGLDLQLTPNVIAPFLDLVTDAKEFDLGKWLLRNDTIKGSIIPPSMYGDAVLQPSLIRFASVTRDRELLDRVTQQIETPISEMVLRALLHHQIQSGHWDAVHDILGLFRDGDGLAWDPTDVMAFARAILNIENQPAETACKGPTHPRALTLFTALLRGQYNTAHDPSRPRDLSETRMLNQLARIIASVPSRLGEDLLPFCSREHNQFSADCIVPSKAFNMLLESVVELFGVLTGKQFCERWCFSTGVPTHPRRVVRFSNRDDKPVVQPDIQTFYIILRPLLQVNNGVDEGSSDSHASHSSDGEELISGNEQQILDISKLPTKTYISEQQRSVVDWAVSKCSDLGVSLEKPPTGSPD
ncbi:MAG: hypothetical protein Q9219_004534 [cf. Caloplaca sp. 3 TL-2023]